MSKIKSIKSIVENENDKFLKEFREYNSEGKELVKEIYLGPDQLEEKNITKYNEKGLIVEEINYGQNNELNTKTIYNRDTNGNVSEIIIEFADSSKTIKSYNYENNGKIVTVIEKSDEGEFEGMTRIIRDDNGNIVESHVFSENNEIIEKHLFEFDDKGNILKDTFFQKSNISTITKYNYDENKNLIKRVISSSDGKIIDWAIFNYDEKGNLVEQQFGDHTLYKIEYNENDKPIIEQKVNAMGVVDYYKKYEYNSENELIKEEDIDEVTNYEYTYY